MVRKPTNKPKNEGEVEVESPKTPVTPEFIDSDVVSSPISPTFTTIEHEDTKIWSSSFSWNMQTTSSEFDNTTMSNVWEADNSHTGQLDGQSDITKKVEIIENKKDDFEENVWTDVQVVAGMSNNQSILSVPFIVPDSPTILKLKLENVPTISKNDESIPSHQEREDNDGSENSNEITNPENFDYVDLGKDNTSPSKELSNEYDVYTNSDVKLELSNNKILNENKDLFEQCENGNSEKIVVDEDDDFGAFECSEENESNFDDFSEFKSENTNDIGSYQGNEKSSSDIDDEFDDFKNNEKIENVPYDNNIMSQRGLSPDLKDFMSITNSVAEWIAILDKIYDLQISNENNDNERPVSIEDLVYNSHAMMNTRLNWSSFIKLWSDQGGIVKFTWRDSQIRKAFLESVNSTSAIKTADRLPGSDLFNDDFSPKSPISPNHFTYSDKTNQYEKSSTETLFVDTNNMPIQDVPEEPIENNNNNKQSKDSNRDSWISMSDISFLESFTSKISSKFDKKKTQQNSEQSLEDFLDIKTRSPTSTVNNSRIDSVIAKIGRNSTNLSAKLGSLKSHVFGSNGTSIPVKENSSSSSIKHPVAINLLEDSINDMIVSNEKENSSITPMKNKETSNFEDMDLDSKPIDDLNQHDFFFSNFNNQSSINNNTTSSKMNTKLDDIDDLLNSEKMLDNNTKDNSSISSEFGLANNDNDLSNLGNQKQEDNWIFSTDLSFLESFTNNAKSSAPNSRKSQQNSFFDFSEFDLNLSSNVQPVQSQKTSDTFLKSIPESITNNISKVKEERQENQQPNNATNSSSKQLYSSSMNVSSTSISSSDFGEMVSANDTENQNFNDDWMFNTSTNQDNWMSNSGLSFLETLKTSPNNNYHNSQKSKQTFGDLDEFILPLNNNSNYIDKIKKSNNQGQQQIHELFF
ncbi:hypothetical protein RclHR1_02370023 [Rhizophagus clarus]|uniref:Uncharacterized protein n=1 Tax=Rhizophagus clarus TaxID=94130 RepID=A0A2Z6QW35_9GLOM|nr:hypothetical protein RclHR1_02370023 [Rhizophagus clarus]GES78480.1 hypothetical protein GLOIN_2v1656730 [Rhizophagus clarus]